MPQKRRKSMRFRRFPPVRWAFTTQIAGLTQKTRHSTMAASSLRVTPISGYLKVGDGSIIRIQQPLALPRQGVIQVVRQLETQGWQDRLHGCVDRRGGH
jgi:hypothetical protein